MGLGVDGSRAFWSLLGTRGLAWVGICPFFLGLLIVVLCLPERVEARASSEQAFSPTAYLQTKQLKQEAPVFAPSANQVATILEIPGLNCRPDFVPPPARRSCAVNDRSCLGSVDRPQVLGLDRNNRSPEPSELAEQVFSQMRDRCWPGAGNDGLKAGFHTELELSLAPGTELNLSKRRGISASVGISGRF